MGDWIKVTFGDGQEISGDSLEDVMQKLAMGKLQAHKESSRIERITDVVKPRRAAKVDADGNRI